MVHAVGFGVRYRTPVGPLRVDLGYSINPSAVLRLQRHPAGSDQCGREPLRTTNQCSVQQRQPFSILLLDRTDILRRAVPIRLIGALAVAWRARGEIIDRIAVSVGTASSSRKAIWIGDSGRRLSGRRETRFQPGTQAGRGGDADRTETDPDRTGEQPLSAARSRRAGARHRTLQEGAFQRRRRLPGRAGRVRHHRAGLQGNAALAAHPAAVRPGAFRVRRPGISRGGGAVFRPRL